MADPIQESSLPVIQKLIRTVGAVAGTVVGVGTLAFSAGFLAQRALYDFVQVPFVFIDYWAYAETGVMALVRSVSLFVAQPFSLIVLTAVSIAIVMMLENGNFRRGVLRPELIFVGYLCLIIWLGILLHQQAVVLQLRDGPIGEEVGDTWHSTTVPARLPFSLSVPPPLELPSPNDVQFPKDSVEFWSQLADDLEQELQEGAVYLEVRPKPEWSVVKSGPGSVRAPVLRVPIDSDRLDASRAQELYRVLVVALVTGVWGFVILTLWQRRVYDELARKAESSKNKTMRSRWNHLLYRLREEIWFSSRWILRSVAALLLTTSGVFFMPECYGLLAMARLGQEYVEVITEPAKLEDDEVVGALTLSKAESETEVAEALDLLRNVTSSADVREAQAQWQRQISELEQVGDREAARILWTMANAASAISPALSDQAREALSRVSSRGFSAIEGFILYYPRSETDYLRILQRNPHSPGKRWTIFPVRMANIREVRVKRDERTVRLIELLRQLSEVDAQGRSSLLFEAETLGHDLLMEVAIGGTYDPSHLVRGFSITDIGRYASGLPDRPDRELRWAIAKPRLLEVLEDPLQRDDHRATAATALHRFVPVGDDEVCKAIIKMLAQDEKVLADDQWVARGAAITTLGSLRCTAALDRLLKTVRDPVVPSHVRASIPTQLIRVGTQADSAPTLGDLLNDPEAPIDARGTSITALSQLEGSDTRVAVEALIAFLTSDDYGDGLESAGLVNDYRMAAVDSLRQIGNPACVETLERLAENQSEDSDVRAKTIIGLGEFQDPGSESLLMTIAETPGDETVRFLAILALGNLDDDQVARRLVDLHPSVSGALKEAIVSALKRRGQSGSSYSASKSKELFEADRPELRDAAAALTADPPLGSQQAASASDNLVIDPEPVTLRVGEEATGSLGPEDNVLDDGSLVEAMPFHAFQGVPLTLDLMSSEFDPLLLIMGPGMGEPLIDDDSGGRCNARITFTPTETGLYIAFVNSAGIGSGTGGFLLRISANPPPVLEDPCLGAPN